MIDCPNLTLYYLNKHCITLHGGFNGSAIQQYYGQNMLFTLFNSVLIFLLITLYGGWVECVSHPEILRPEYVIYLI